MAACNEGLRSPRTNSDEKNGFPDGPNHAIGHFADIVGHMSDRASRVSEIANELKAIIKNAGQDFDLLSQQLRVLPELTRVEMSLGEGAKEPERAMFLVRVVIPEALTRLGAETADAMATQDLFQWNSRRGGVSTLTARYLRAVDHYEEKDITASTFGRRYEPRLLKQLASLIVEIDAEDKLQMVAPERLDWCTALWGFQPNDTVSFVFPELPQADRSDFASENASYFIRLHKFADLDSLFELKAFFAKHFPGVRTNEYTWRDAPNDALAGNVVVVGGIAYNEMMSDALERMNSPFTQVPAPAGEVDSLIDTRDSHMYGPTWSSSGTVTSDHGMFVRAPNPLNPASTMILINGVLTHGVLGATKCFTDRDYGPENCKVILDAVDVQPPQFAALMKVPVLASHVPSPNLADRNLVDIIEYPFLS